MDYGFGVDLGGTTVKIAFFDRIGTLLDKWEIPTVTQNGGREILPDIARAVQGYLNTNRIPQERILGIGIGVPGPVLPDGTVNKCINLGWGVFSIQRELETLTGVPVKAANDASLAALGECWKGSGQGCKNMVFATLGTGVGGGIVIDGKVLHGTAGAAGEFGHMVLNREERDVCPCGKRGCAEQYCSATGIVRIARRCLQETDTASALRDIQPLTCKDIFDVAAAGDGLAGQILEQAYAYLGELFANVCCIADPEVVVIGGGVSKAGQPLLDGIVRYYQQYVFHASRKVRFAIASLGNDAGVYGAFKLILDAQWCNSIDETLP